MEAMKRAVRRAHVARIKSRFVRKERARPYWHAVDAYAQGRYAATHKTCSCWICGNPRRHLGDVTLDELRAEDVLAADLADWVNR